MTEGIEVVNLKIKGRVIATLSRVKRAKMRRLILLGLERWSNFTLAVPFVINQQVELWHR